MAQAQWQSLQGEAVRWRRAKEPDRAIDCLTRAITLTRQSPDLARETGTLLNYLADVYLQEGVLDQAELTIRQALQSRKDLPASEQNLAADDLMILAKVLNKQGRHREAVEAGSQALALFEKFPGADDEFISQIKELLKRFRQDLAQAKAGDRGLGLPAAPSA
jgi:tetratricopeptide (TPR) repeat protein